MDGCPVGMHVPYTRVYLGPEPRLYPSRRYGRDAGNLGTLRPGVATPIKIYVRTSRSFVWCVAFCIPGLPYWKHARLNMSCLNMSLCARVLCTGFPRVLWKRARNQRRRLALLTASEASIVHASSLAWTIKHGRDRRIGLQG